MRPLAITLAAALTASALPALADFQKVTTRDDFMALVGGKTLTRPLVKIQVLPDGQIAGTGAAWEVTGQWEWQGEYLCRSLEWGGDDLGYNCQEVKVDGNNMRITSDKGTGRSADFSLR
ncbi:dihydrodipicolinate reductase [Sulfitobacter alexandrii]|uniref:Dihydrodipicolinate reductase n=1 Tax=Sulfitobacter alexandrii TaxID=1917485 RepID=A0A1J0WKE4_9RHOB|nr:dihydrodipicolinate reductase [Sulfitobacter alexandrii]APE44809.1 dihydrodipicolinate reductase [Sulfitobacter alexandrii]